MFVGAGDTCGVASLAPRSSPLSFAPYRRLMVAAAVSNIGSGVQAVTLGWLAFHLTHDARLVGLLAFLAFTPRALLSHLGGALAAAVGPLRVGIAAYSASALPWAVMAVIAALGRITYRDLAVVVTINAILAAFARVGLQDVVPLTVPDGIRDRAIAIETGVAKLSGLIGPALGGVLLATAGAVTCFAVNAASYLPVAGALLTVGLPDLREGSGGIWEGPARRPAEEHCSGGAKYAPCW